MTYVLLLSPAKTSFMSGAVPRQDTVPDTGIHAASSLAVRRRLIHVRRTYAAAIYPLTHHPSAFHAYGHPGRWWNTISGHATAYAPPWTTAPNAARATTMSTLSLPLKRSLAGLLLLRVLVLTQNGPAHSKFHQPIPHQC